MKNPNLFIVGAPKCGTTFLYHYLKKHPDIYFPEFKEPHYFGSDLIRRNGAYNLSLREYKNLFSTEKKVIGEASTFYLFSKKAAQEIYNFNPHSKIIIMLRDLVDLVHSLHSQFVFSGDEVIEISESVIDPMAEEEGYVIHEEYDPEDEDYEDELLDDELQQEYNE